MILLAAAIAGAAGTVSGLVTDQNGQAVSGALVVVKGTNRFATTNADGYYVITPVPVGSFDVKASRVGFSEQVKTGVKVIAGLRTNISFQLQSEAAGVTYIQSEEPLIKFNQPYTETIPGTDVTYGARIESAKNEVREAFRSELTEEQYAEFEDWRMDPTEIQEIEDSPWADFEDRIAERVEDLKR